VLPDRQQPAQTSTSGRAPAVEVTAAADAAAAAASRQAAYEASTGPDASPIQLRLAKELFGKGFSDFRSAGISVDVDHIDATFACKMLVYITNMHTLVATVHKGLSDFRSAGMFITVCTDVPLGLHA
jgi:hypothetical protein